MIRVILLAVTLALTGSASSWAQNSFNDAQKQDIGKIVREYLLSNPEVLAEAMQVLQQREEAKQAEAARAAIDVNRNDLIADKRDPIGGNPNGAITVVEFFDYNCPYCRRAKPVVAELLKSDNRIRYVFKELPILSPSSRVAARVALAVWQSHPDKYWNIHNQLMKTRGQVSNARLVKVIEAEGLDWRKIEALSKSPAVDKHIEHGIALAGKLGINGTPSFVIGNQIFPGLVPLEALKAAVERVKVGGN